MSLLLLLLSNGWLCSEGRRKATSMKRVDLTPEMTQFVTERHLATLTIVTPNGRPHVTPVGFTWDKEQKLARVITWAGSMKSKLLEKAETPLKAAVSQVDGGRWITLEGSAVVTADTDKCAEGTRRYAERYSEPKDRGDDRRVIEITIERVMGRA